MGKSMASAVVPYKVGRDLEAFISLPSIKLRSVSDRLVANTHTSYIGPAKYSFAVVLPINSLPATPLNPLRAVEPYAVPLINQYVVPDVVGPSYLTTTVFSGLRTLELGPESLPHQ